MRDVYDYAKFFLKKGADSVPNTFDGNMKLQKLLVFAYLANIAEYGKPLYDDEILAFQNGCVVEKVRLRYKNDYSGIKKDSDSFQPNFTDQEYGILNLTLEIFGKATAKELSEINHTFNFWNEAFKNGTTSSGYHSKSKSIVDIGKHPKDIDTMRNIIAAYRESQSDVTAFEMINGITFYYDNFHLTDEMIDQLEQFSLHADDDVYTVYLDEERLVIY